MMLFALAMLLVTPQCHGLALVALSVRATSLWGRFAPRQQRAPTAQVLYAQQMSSSESTTEETPVSFDMSDDDVAAYRSEMLNLVYERNVERLMK